jgi:anti-sigma B factor antagonist
MTKELSQSEVDAMLGRCVLPQDLRYTTRIEVVTGVLFLRLTGTLLQPIPDEFSQRIHDIFRDYPGQRAVVDLSKCTFMSSSAIGTVVDFFHASNTTGGQVLLIKPPEKILKLIEILGLSSLFLTVEDDVMAINYFIAQAKLCRQTL